MNAKTTPIRLATAMALVWAAVQTAVPAAPIAEPTNREDAPMEKIVKTDAEWRALLTPEQYRVTRQQGT